MSEETGRLKAEVARCGIGQFVKSFVQSKIILIIAVSGSVISEVSPCKCETSDILSVA